MLKAKFESKETTTNLYSTIQGFKKLLFILCFVSHFIKEKALCLRKIRTNIENLFPLCFSCFPPNHLYYCLCSILLAAMNKKDKISSLVVSRVSNSSHGWCKWYPGKNNQTMVKYDSYSESAKENHMTKREQKYFRSGCPSKDFRE